MKQQINTLSSLSEELQQIKHETETYLEQLQDEELGQTNEETLEQSIIRHESILDKLMDIDGRRNEIIFNGKQTLSSINNHLNLQIDENEEFRDEIKEINNQLIDEIISLKELKRNKDILPLKQQIQIIKQQFEKEKVQLDNCRIETIEERKNREQFEFNKSIELSKQKSNKQRLQPFRDFIEKEGNKQYVRLNDKLDYEEIYQLEEWTSKKVGEVLFDSFIDNWEINKSVFTEKVINK